MYVTIKKWPAECFAHHSEQEKKWGTPKVSEQLSEAVQREFLVLGGIQTLPFPFYVVEWKQLPWTTQVPTITKSCWPLALELYAVQEWCHSRQLPRWLQQCSKSLSVWRWQSAGSSEPNTASVPQHPVTLPLPQQDLWESPTLISAAPILALALWRTWYISSGPY